MPSPMCAGNAKRNNDAPNKELTRQARVQRERQLIMAPGRLADAQMHNDTMCMRQEILLQHLLRSVTSGKPRSRWPLREALADCWRGLELWSPHSK